MIDTSGDGKVERAECVGYFYKLVGLDATEGPPSGDVEMQNIKSSIQWYLPVENNWLYCHLISSIQFFQAKSFIQLKFINFKIHFNFIYFTDLKLVYK